MADLQALKAFDISHSTITLWVFKKSTRAGQLIYTGRWVETSEVLDSKIKENVSSAILSIEEIREYSLLAENNGTSVLSIPVDETHAARLIQECVARDEKKIKKIKEIQNAQFYVIRFTFNDQQSLYAVKSTDDSWKLRKLSGAYRAAFKDNALDLDDTPTFNISKHIDFFIFNNDVIAKSKQKTESILNYKEAHREDFTELKLEPKFSSLFSNMDAINNYVGDNKMQLRRASAIRQKAHYNNDVYIQNIRDNAVEMRLPIDFDANGKIVPTAENCKFIFLALLNHRLFSRFSGEYYDVQNIENIQ
ncbi:Kiwa anti-phage protein KwaB-like domain-containing protein [uncultured Pseudomonas sp.]|uniref:Kiwa anti-phage protein KwaB-like domain-containing protein n=1 Tax=uncultured Pseudomonas sp. TaxID=114707 RepID=UPI0027DB4C8D|nr:Kiwa anti-phage protein KwaB-like domain-containing protein [uncultured Pseudomonas sp.]